MKKVVFVDDSRYTRATLKRILTDAGYEAHEAADGATALELIKSVRPDALVVDLLMAGMTGQELIRTVRFADPAIPIAVVTADIQESTREQCRQLGANLVISKNCLFPDGARFLAEFTKLLPKE